jgi:hypothetical protein
MLKRSPIAWVSGGAVVLWFVSSLAVNLSVTVNAQSNCLSTVPQAPQNLRIVSLLMHLMPALSAQSLPCLRNASNTGLAGAGISESSLTNQGSITYGTSFNGQTISGIRFTGPVIVTGTNITFDGVLFSVPNNAGTWTLDFKSGTNTVRNSTFRPASGSAYEGVIIEGGSITLDKVDISHHENNISVYAGSLHLVDSYVHDPTTASPSGHVDGIEIYGGSNMVIERSTVYNQNSGTVSPFNIAPWSGNTSVSNLTIQDNYIDGGNAHILVDLQSTGTVQSVRILRNRMGGHTASTFGPYMAFQNADNRGTVETEAALQASPNSVRWPTTGADVNLWFYCTSNAFGFPNLSPDRSGTMAR